jgi:mRNA interferase MazF
MNLNRGDVVLVLFPDSNLRTAKRRPALIVQAGGHATGLPQTIIARITSNLARAGPSHRVLLKLGTPAAQGTGLRTDSVIMADNLATVLDSEIDRRIGGLADLSAVDRGLRQVLGL